MSDTDYDVVIVGAGIMGALVAKSLYEAKGAGIGRILILEAGENTGMSAEGYRSYIDHYYEQMIKVPNAPYPANPNAPAANVIDLSPIPPQITKGYMVQNGPYPFLSDNTRATGGTTLHWLGTCLRMLPHDFELKTRYDQAHDWPIRYQDLKPFYERAEYEIGVSADVEDQIYPNMGPDYFGDDYVFPMHKVPQSYLDQVFGERLSGLSVDVPGQTSAIDVSLVSTPQGRNSTPNQKANGGQGYTPVGMVGDSEKGMRCEGNSSCVPICPVQAKYSALKTLNAIPLGDQVILQAKCVASNINVDSASGRITSIDYKEYQSPDAPDYVSKRVTAKTFVLAAHAIENAKLLLASNVANSSDQVGRNLMDHLVMLTWGLMPKNIGAFRGPGSTSGIASFRDGDFRRTMSAFRVELGNWGWSWPTAAPFSDVTNFVNQRNLFGKDLRDQLKGWIPRQFRIGWEAEQLPRADNRVTIDPQYTDQIGNYRPVIDYSISDYVRKSLAEAKQVSDQIWAKLGIEDHTSYTPDQAGYFTYEGTGYTANGAGHMVGTHRMGANKADSVVDSNSRSWDHENLYIVGCGSMTTLGTSNPTLTAAALTLKAADQIIADFKGGAC